MNDYIAMLIMKKLSSKDFLCKLLITFDDLYTIYRSNVNFDMLNSFYSKHRLKCIQDCDRIVDEINKNRLAVINLADIDPELYIKMIMYLIRYCELLNKFSIEESNKKLKLGLMKNEYLYR